MKKVLMLIAGSILLSGCIEQKTEKQEVSKPEVVVSTLTPQDIVSSWWRVKDILAEQRYALCLQDKELGGFDHLRESLAYGEVLDVLGSQNCYFAKYDRSIERVDEEGDIAVVHALVKNISPADEGITLSFDELSVKSMGEKYRYKLKNIAGDSPSWRITQIYTQIPSTGSWYPIFEKPGLETNHRVSNQDQ